MTGTQRRLGFGGDVARLYDRYRRGYPPAVIDAIVDALGLSSEDAVIDLGCGTGQLTVPLAERVRLVVGVDPEPDMLWLARGHDDAVKNVTWLLGSDEELPAIAAGFRQSRLGAVTVATALHWMDLEAVLQATRSAVRPGGGLAIVTNGKPLWRLDIAWSQRLREFLDRWTGRESSMSCGTADEDQQRYRDLVAAAGLDVSETVVSYTDELDADRLVGGVLSTFSAPMLPRGEERLTFREGLMEAVGAGPYPETVDVGLIFGVVK